MGHGENFSENFKKEIAKIINFRFLQIFMLLHLAKTQLGFPQTSKMESFTTTMKDEKTVSFVLKPSILDICGGPGYASAQGLNQSMVYLYCVKSARIRSFSGLQFLVFGLNTERYSEPLHTQSECGKIRTRDTSNTNTFYAVHVLIVSSSSCPLLVWTLVILQNIFQQQQRVSLNKKNYSKISKKSLMLRKIAQKVFEKLFLSKLVICEEVKASVSLKTLSGISFVGQNFYCTKFLSPKKS